MKKMVNLQRLTIFFAGWSCRESNPGPNILAISFLHVYFGINCRENAGTKHTNNFLR